MREAVEAKFRQHDELRTLGRRRFKIRTLYMIAGIVLCCLLAAAAYGFESTRPAAVMLLGGGAVVLAIGLALFLYFLPTLIARDRNHRNANGITLVNLFFGWTLLGWVGALVWATYEEKK